MNGLEALKVGDPVVVYRDYYREPATVTRVTRVGRKYLYVATEQHGFSRDDGSPQERAVYNSHVRTLERHAYLERVRVAKAELWTAGVRVEHAVSDDLLFTLHEALTIHKRTAQPSSTNHLKKDT